ncbi:unnamed protein product [Sphagnum troendelagicum]|uniref:Uncharacterized protein n=1 Tax=Sphagnum troendelagicum TaxID=128251 RepID=A0ABP0UVE1_9BRYO
MRILACTITSTNLPSRDDSDLQSAPDTATLEDSNNSRSFFKLPDETTDMVKEFNSGNSGSNSILSIDL